MAQDLQVVKARPTIPQPYASFYFAIYCLKRALHNTPYQILREGISKELKNSTRISLKAWKEYTVVKFE